MIHGWHFVGDTLRDGSPIPADGVWLRHEGEIAMCISGLHMSRDPFDALQYAPGSTLCKVVGREDVEEGKDKLVCRERMIVKRKDVTDLLRRFARECALDVIDKWDAPEIVVRYLKTGDESIRAAAWDAAWAAARGAAWGAAWGATRAAARAAAGDARAAAGAAARAAAGAAAGDVAWYAAGDVAWYAAGDVAWYAAWAAQRKRFSRMVEEAFA